MTVSILSEETINKIAAGEVVERPANAVKELVENALDADAHSIVIDIRQAGKTRIRIADDGDGMSRDDLLLAVERHATSKIKTFADVSSIISLGFRGEALPSIAAVSHLAIQTQRRSDPLHGWELKLSAGKQTLNQAWSGSPGTIVEVSQLFFNTPAREKFLKSATTERNRIAAIVEEMALARPDCGFTLTSDGKTLLNVSRGQTTIERITAVSGAKSAQGMLKVDASHPQISLTAFITPRTNPLSTKSFQYLFVNQRPVNFPKFLYRSLYDAYRENLPVGTHPGAVVYLTIDPGEIDVNIHPTKREVRFSHEQELYQFFFSAVRNTLTQSGFTAPGATLPKPDELARPYSGYQPSQTQRASYSPEIRERTDMLYTPGHQELSQLDEKNLRALGQVFGTYGIVFWNKQLMIVDQHAAAERVRYERYRTQWMNHTIAVQPLLLPLTIELPPSRMGLVRDNLIVLKEVGWDIEEFGKTTILINAVPAVLGTDSAASNLFAVILDALGENMRLPQPERIETVIRAACRASIKAHESLSQKELTQLMTDLFACEMPHTCPHGRPTYQAFTETSLEKMFHRG
ncbi:MAG: DNA mismatch repair endonuclease MutL [Elusimicrobia bacterium]|nr:DNA mismatch repair endonuclease MutL [Elusimicrobiota bacterium]